LILGAAAAMGACAAPAGAPVAETPPNAELREESRAAADDGTYLARIDPLGGRWRVERIGDEEFMPFDASVHFSAGGFLNHGAGCGGGHPAFYRLDANRLTIARRGAVRIGKCGSGSAREQAAAAASERRLARFLDEAVTWSRPDERTLLLDARDGIRAVLTRPRQPHPELAGKWLVESIGGKPFVTERRPPQLTFDLTHIGAQADCNGIGGSFTIPEPGQIAVSGLLSTAMGCAPEDHAEDALMMSAMRSAKSYRIQGDVLVVTGAPGMVLRRPPQANRRLTGEYEACGNTMLGGAHEGPVTLSIGKETMRDSAGCTADYVAEGPRLTLRLHRGPACADTAPHYVPGEAVAIGGEISSLAVAPPDAFGFDEDGRLIIRTSRGHLMMCRKGSPPPFGN
jgi:heat shock protein HslJ